ncbi:MAG: class I SAM-dependent methyltransferase [bacterium]|nr:class I SAM-dependent methyltransferase [bacterium]
MIYITFGYRLPYFISKVLFGDRRRFGVVANTDDPCWKEWEKTYLDFYYNNQKKSVGKIVNNAGYHVMSKIDMEGKKILEIGPGDISHIPYWRSKPDLYIIADTQNQMLDLSSKKLERFNINYSKILVMGRGFIELPFRDEELDIIVSFYTFEHLFPLENYLKEFKRILKKGGRIVGAIPCEGGLAWDLGRFFTTRRWFKRNTNINPDKIICWEHPNFADTVLKTLDLHMKRLYVNFWPFKIPFIDFNLIVSFIYEKQ